MEHHERVDKMRTAICIWVTGLFLLGMLAFVPGNIVSATTSGNIPCSIGVGYYDNYGAWSHDQMYMLPGSSVDRQYFDFNLEPIIGAGVTITSFVFYIYITNDVGLGVTDVKELPAFTNSTYTTTTMGSLLCQISNSGYTLNAWNIVSNSAINSYAQTMYNADGHVYIALDSLNMGGGGGFGVGGDSNPHATYCVVTYSGGGGSTWAPTFTSSPDTTGTIGVQYVYNATWNETIDLPITGYWLPDWATTDTNGINFWGTPLTGGVYPFILEATSTNGTLASWQFWNVTVPGSGTWDPTFTSTPITAACVGVPYSYYCTVNESLSDFPFAGSYLAQPSVYNGTPSNDATLVQSDPNTNYNGATMTADTTNKYAVMLWDDLPNGVTIDAIYVHMYKTANSGTGHSNFGAGSNYAWNESTVTWNSYNPTWYGGNYVGITETATGWVNYTSPTLTGYLAQQYYDTGKISLLTTVYDGSPSKTWQTTEGANQPYMTIQYTYYPTWADITWDSHDNIGWLNGTPTTPGIFRAEIEAWNYHGGYTQQFFNITVGEPIDVIFSTANNTAFYADGTSHYVWWNASGGTFPLDHYMESWSDDNGSGWTSWELMYGDHTGWNLLGGAYIRERVYAVDDQGFAGPTSEIWFHFVSFVLPTLVIDNPGNKTAHANNELWYIYYNATVGTYPIATIAYKLYYNLVPYDWNFTTAGWQVGGSYPSIPVQNYGVGTWMFQLAADDNHGNRGPSVFIAWVSIANPPTVVITSPADHSIVAYPWSLTVTWSGTAGSNPISYYQYRVYASGAWGSWSAHTITLTRTYTPSTDGQFEVKVVDTMGYAMTATINYTLAPLVIAFTSTPITTATNHTTYLYEVATNAPATITLTNAPSWLHYSSITKRLTGTTPSDGVWTVTLEAIALGTYANQTFTIIAQPTVPAHPVSDQWLMFIPLLMLFVLTLLTSYNPEDGFSGLTFLSVLSIGIVLLVWTGTLPIFAIVVPALIMGLLLYREARL